MRNVKGLCRTCLALGAGLALALAGLACGRAETPPRSPERVWIVGVESLSPTRVEALLDAGELPTLARLVEGGTWVEAEASLPLEPMSVWTTAFTGKLPQKHQAIGPFVRLPNGQRSVAPSTMRKTQSIWTILSEHEYALALVGFPGTWPAEVVQGFLVSNGAFATRWMEASESTFSRVPGLMDTYPPSLYREITPLLREAEDVPREVPSRFITMTEDEFRMFYDLPLGSLTQGDNPLREFALTYAADASAMDVLLHLDDTYTSQVMGVYLELLGALQPVYWPFLYPEVFRTPSQHTRRLKNAVDEAYRWVDQQLARVVDRMGPHDTLMVVSASGFDTVLPPGAGRAQALPTDQGTFLLYGEGIRAGHRVTGAELADFAPTLLGLLGEDLGEDMDGSCLTDAFEPAFAEAFPRTFRESYDTRWKQDERYPDLGLGENDAARALLDN